MQFRVTLIVDAPEDTTLDAVMGYVENSIHERGVFTDTKLGNVTMEGVCEVRVKSATKKGQRR